jgi:hypothetical protein
MKPELEEKTVGLKRKFEDIDGNPQDDGIKK